MTRPLIVGMADPSGIGPLRVLSVPRGAAGHRLWKISGMPMPEYLAAFERRNLVPGRGWRPIEARIAGAKFMRKKSDRVVVVLGRETWRALGLDPVEPGERVGRFVFVPHPSGRNLWYNVEANRDRIGRLLRSLAGG